MLALGAWGFKAMGEPREEQIITPDSMTMDLRTAFRPQVAASLPATAYAARFGPAELLIRVDGPTLDVTRGDGPVDLAFAAGPGIRRLISGELAAGSRDRDRRGRGAARARRPPRPLRDHLPPGRLTHDRLA